MADDSAVVLLILLLRGRRSDATAPVAANSALLPALLLRVRPPPSLVPLKPAGGSLISEVDPANVAAALVLLVFAVGAGTEEGLAGGARLAPLMAGAQWLAHTRGELGTASKRRCCWEEKSTRPVDSAAVRTPESRIDQPIAY